MKLRRVPSVGFDERERQILLLALFHLRALYAEDVAFADEIKSLVVKLRGDYDAVFFGGLDRADDIRSAVEYPADETDEG